MGSAPQGRRIKATQLTLRIALSALLQAQFVVGSIPLALPVNLIRIAIGLREALPRAGPPRHVGINTKKNSGSSCTLFGETPPPRPCLRLKNSLKFPLQRIFPGPVCWIGSLRLAAGEKGGQIRRGGAFSIFGL